MLFFVTWECPDESIAQLHWNKPTLTVEFQIDFFVGALWIEFSRQSHQKYWYKANCYCSVEKEEFSLESGHTLLVVWWINLDLTQAQKTWKAYTKLWFNPNKTFVMNWNTVLEQGLTDDISAWPLDFTNVFKAQLIKVSAVEILKSIVSREESIIFFPFKKYCCDCILSAQFWASVHKVYLREWSQLWRKVVECIYCKENNFFLTSKGQKKSFPHCGKLVYVIPMCFLPSTGSTEVYLY